MASTDNIIIITTCAACGNEGGDSLKACTACKLVKYCNRECQIAHRPQHKKACKKRAAELHDEALFKVPPPPEDCPICFLPLPLGSGQTMFQSCCGKIICNGCIYAMDEEARGRGKIDLCPFCRAPIPSSDEDLNESIKQIKKLMEARNANAFNMFAGYYRGGVRGMPQDFAKANELYLKAGELGCAGAYYNLGNSYRNGEGVEVDMNKTNYYWELAAMNGSLEARHNLGCMEYEAGKYDRAFKHYILSASAGFKQSLDAVKEGFITGYVTKDEYENTLRAFKKIQDEMKSDDRDEAATVESSEV